MSASTFNYDVFISYNWGIKKEVEEFHKKLEAVGIKAWRDINLQANNQNITSQLAKQIKNSRIFLCFLTKAYSDSDMCRKEIVYADKLRKTIIFLMIERMTVNEMHEDISFIMGNKVYTQCYKKPNSWWIDDFDGIRKSIEGNLKVIFHYFLN